jgi:hypothetical protein
MAYDFKNLSIQQQVLAVGVALTLILVLYAWAPQIPGLEGISGVEDTENTVVVQGPSFTPGAPHILSEDETWEAGKTYILNADVIIPPQWSLTIEEGVKVFAKGGGGYAAQPFAGDPSHPEDTQNFWAMNVGIYVYGSLIVNGDYDEGMVEFANQNQLMSDYSTGQEHDPYDPIPEPWYEWLWNGIHILPPEEYDDVYEAWGSILPGDADDPPFPPDEVYDRLVHIDYAEVKDAYVGISVCGRSMYREKPTVTISNNHIHDNNVGILVGVGMAPRSMHDLDMDGLLDLDPEELGHGPVKGNGADLDGDGIWNDDDYWDFPGDGLGLIDTSYDAGFQDVTGLWVNGDGIRDTAFPFACGVYPAIPKTAGSGSPLIENNYIENNYDFELAPYIHGLRYDEPPEEDPDGDGWRTPTVPPETPPPSIPETPTPPPYEYGLTPERIIMEGDGLPFPNGLPPLIEGGTGIHIVDASPIIRYNNINRNEDYGVVDVQFSEDFFHYYGAFIWNFWEHEELNEPPKYAYIPDPQYEDETWHTNTVLYHNNLIANGYEAWWNLPIFDPTVIRCDGCPPAPTGWWLTDFDLFTEANFVKGNSVTWHGSDPVDGTANKIEDEVHPYLASQVAGGVDPRINPKVDEPWQDVGIQGRPLALDYRATSVEGSNVVDWHYNIYDQDDEQVTDVITYYRDLDDTDTVVTGALDVADYWSSPSQREGIEFYDIIGSDHFNELSPDNDDIYHVEWSHSDAIGQHAEYTRGLDTITIDGHLDESVWLDLTYKEQEAGFFNTQWQAGPEDEFYLMMGNDVSSATLYIGMVFCSVEPGGDAMDNENLMLYSDFDGDYFFDETLSLADDVLGGTYEDTTFVTPGEVTAGAAPFSRCDDGGATPKRMFEMKLPYSYDPDPDPEQIWYDSDLGFWNFKMYYQKDPDSQGTVPPHYFVFPAENINPWVYGTDIPVYMQVQMQRYYTGWHWVELEELVNDPNVWEGSATLNPVDLEDIEWYTMMHGPHRDMWFHCHLVNKYDWYFTLWDGTDNYDELDPYSGLIAATDGPADIIADLDDFVDTDLSHPGPYQYVIVPGNWVLIMKDIDITAYETDDLVQIVNYGTIVAGELDDVLFSGPVTIANFGEATFSHIQGDAGATGNVKKMPWMYAQAGDVRDITEPISILGKYEGQVDQNIYDLGITIPKNNEVTTTISDSTFLGWSQFVMAKEDPRCNELLDPSWFSADPAFEMPNCNNLVELDRNYDESDNSYTFLFATGHLTESISSGQDGEGNGVNWFIQPELQSMQPFTIEHYRADTKDDTAQGVDCIDDQGTPGLGYLDGSSICGVGLYIRIIEYGGPWAPADLDALEDSFNFYDNQYLYNDEDAIYLEATPYPIGDSTREEELQEFAGNINGDNVPDKDQNMVNNDDITETATGEDYTGGQVHDVKVDAGTTPDPTGPEGTPDQSLFCDIECIHIVQPGGEPEEVDPVLDDIIAFDEVIRPNATGRVVTLAHDDNLDTLTYFYEVGIVDPENVSDCGGIDNTPGTNPVALYTSPLELPEGIDEIMCYINVSVSDGQGTDEGQVIITVRDEEVIIQQIVDPAAEGEEEEDSKFNEVIIPAWLMIFLLAFIATLLTIWFFGDQLGFEGDFKSRFALTNRLFVVYVVWVLIFWLIHLFVLDLTFDLGYWLTGQWL